MTSRRTPNRFDNDTLPAGSSHDTSTASVETVAHQPTTRRRVSSPDCSSPTKPDATRGDGGVSPVSGRPRSRHDPYMYNVLGDKASPQMQQRTSPIPEFQVPSHVGMLDSPLQGPQRRFSYDALDDLSAAALLNGSCASIPGTQPVAGVSAVGTPGSPVLGTYMSQAYRSAFPPGHLPRFDEPAIPTVVDAREPALPMSPTTQQRSHHGSSPVVGGKQPRNSNNNNARRATQPHVNAPQQAPADTRLTPLSIEPQNSPCNSVVGVINAITSPTTPMMRVYKNGRPVAVRAPVAN